MVADHSARPHSLLPPLVGREREQAMLRDRLTAALAGQGSLALISGEAGIGKTALAESVCREATEMGALVLVGRCYDVSEAPPYGPWLELFARYRPAEGLPPLPAAFADRGAIGTVAGQAEIFSQVKGFLHAVSARQPLMLLLDDLHWADPASLELLRVIAHGLDSLPILIVATYREDEATSGAALHHQLPTIIREAHAARVSVRRLDENAVCTLVETLYHLRGGEQRRLATYLQERGEGNPFFIGELLRTLEEEGALRNGGLGWALGDLRDVKVPPLVRQVITARLSRLGEEAHRLLTVGALIGQEVPLTLWATVVEQPEEALLATVERAIETHFLEESAKGLQVRFVHALIRETLDENMPISQRRMWHRRMAEVLTAHPNPDPDAVAYHFRQAGDERAATWLIQAGERAEQAHAWLTAADRFEAARIIRESYDADPADCGWLLVRLALLRRYSDTSQAITDMEAAACLAAEIGDCAMAAYTLVCRGWFHCTAGNSGVGLPQMRAGMAAQDALDPTDRARLAERRRAIGRPIVEYNDRTALILWEASAGHYTEAMALANQIPDRHYIASGDLCVALGQIHAMMGRPDDARHFLTQARNAYAIGHPFGVGQTALLDLEWRLLPYHPDHVAEREHIATDGVQSRRRVSRMMKEHESPEFARLPLLILEGRWADAHVLVTGVRATGPGMNYVLATAALCTLAREQGDAAMAWALIYELLPTGLATEPGSVRFPWAIKAQRVAAALALDAGDLPSARAWLEMHDRWVAWNGAVPGRAEAALLWAAYYRAGGEMEQARRHAQQALTHATEPRQPLALLAAHRLLGELETDAGHFTDAETHIKQALILADACAAPYERALTLLARAALQSAKRDIAAAHHALDEMRAICTPLGAKPALARADALAMRLAPAAGSTSRTLPDNVTAREMDVLRLIAQGMSNREIAATLFISTRTVNRHIENLYQKIGAHGKADATAYAFRHQLA